MIGMKTIKDFKLKNVFEKQKSKPALTNEIIQILKSKCSSNGTPYQEGDIVYTCFVYEFLKNNITNGEEPNILCKSLQIVESEFEYYENNFVLLDDEKEVTPILIKP